MADIHQLRITQDFQSWLFHPEYGAQAADVARARLDDRFHILDRHLRDKEFLVGNRFSIADAYCFTILNWSKGRGIDLAAWPNLSRYMSTLAERPSVRDTMIAEGLRT